MDRIESNLVPFHLCLWEMGHAGVYCLVIGQFFNNYRCMSATMKKLQNMQYNFVCMCIKKNFSQHDCGNLK